MIVNWHSSSTLRRETAATWLSFFTVTTNSTWSDYGLQDIHGSLGCWSELVFLYPIRRGLRGNPYKVLQGTSHRRRRGVAFSAWVVKYWNRLPASVVTTPSVNVFKTSFNRGLSSSPPSLHPLTFTFLYVAWFPVLPVWLYTTINDNHGKFNLNTGLRTKCTRVHGYWIKFNQSIFATCPKVRFACCSSWRFLIDFWLQCPAGITLSAN